MEAPVLFKSTESDRRGSSVIAAWVFSEQVLKSLQMLMSVPSPPSGCCCRPPAGNKRTCRRGGNAWILLHSSRGDTFIFFPSQIPFCKMSTICSSLSCRQWKQLTNDCCPAAKPLTVQTVGTFTGPSQKLRRYQGGRTRRRSCSREKKREKKSCCNSIG